MVVIQQTIVKYWAIQKTGYRVIDEQKIELLIKAYATQQEAIDNEGVVLDNKLVVVNIVGDEKVNPGTYTEEVAQVIGGVEM